MYYLNFVLLFLVWIQSRTFLNPRLVLLAKVGKPLERQFFFLFGLVQLVELVDHPRLMWLQCPLALVCFLLLAMEVLGFLLLWVQLFKENSSSFFPYIYPFELNNNQLVYKVGAPFLALLVTKLKM